MELLFLLLAFVAGLLLVAAAFVYLVDPGQARQLLGAARGPFVIVVVILASAAVLDAADHRPVVLVGLAAMSVAAYLIRESRKPKREKRPSFGGAERKPLPPPVERETADEDREETR